MAHQFVNWKLDGGIAVVTIDRPPVNALNPAVLGELEKVFAEITRDERAGVVVLTGAGGKAFVAGADIGDLPGITPEAAMKYSRFAQRVYHEIVGECEKVVVCAVNGMAIGGGCELAMGADIRIAAENAVFSLPELNLGVIPGGGGTQVLPRMIPPGKAKQLILTGDVLVAKEARELGLVEEVVPKGEALQRAKEVAGKILAKAPLAVQAAKKAINEGRNLPLKEGMMLEAAYWRALCATEDQKEGARAFLEKRKPVFKKK